MRDGQRIVWRHFEENGAIADVWTMKLDGADKRRVTDFKSMSWAPFPHPSSKYFIFTSNKLGFENFELFLVDVNGEREPVRVTSTNGFDGLPVFSPDGRKLCWTSGRTSDGKAQLFLADWNDEAARAALQSSPARSSESTFSPQISKADLQREVEWLTDEKRAGRMTGSEGAQMTAQWLSEYFQSSGLKAFEGGYQFSFTFNAGGRVIPERNQTGRRSTGRQTHLQGERGVSSPRFQRKRRGKE